jgi:uncharacterized membrane protein YdfJ with MMPL/SSD domain
MATHDVAQLVEQWSEESRTNAIRGIVPKLVTVGFSYLASVGFAMIAFVHLGGSDGLIFVLPLLMFVFSMALGEDYNI